MIRRIAALSAALALVLVVAAPAMAQDLHQTPPIPWNATQDADGNPIEQSCSADELLLVQPGQVLWHFVGHFATDVGVTMTATFSDSQYNVTDQPYDSNTDTYLLDWEIITGETTLTSASVNINTDVDGFNLSHICAAPGTDIPEAPFSALLLLSAGASMLGFFGLRAHRSRTAA